MCIVDYYQAILRESAEKVGLSLSSERDLAGMLNRLATRVLGLERISFDDLSRIRNSTYHSEFRHYAPSELADLLARGPSRRKFLLDATAAAKRHERTLAIAVQRLLATSNEMKVELQTYSKEGQAQWLPKVERARALAISSPLGLDEEGFELLLDLYGQVIWSRTIDAVNAADDGGQEESDYEPESEPEVGVLDVGDDETEPEPTEFDPSEYYPEPDDSGPPDPGPPEEEPPDSPPPAQEHAEHDP